MKWLDGIRMRSIFFGCIIAIVLGGIEFANGATITVGFDAGYDFSTIQAGIDAANDGDMVLVAPGEYVVTEPITFRGKAITVRSEAGRDETTFRMGTPADINRGSVVIFDSGETITSVLEGFKITGGNGTYVPSEGHWVGGGIFCNASSVTVNDCVIAQNSVDGTGGGVYCAHQCSPILIDCIIAENLAENSGGGVVVGYGAHMTINNCTIRGNSAEGTIGMSGAGGGVLCAFDSSMTMTYCTIVENYAAQIGGGVYSGIDNSSVTMTHCVIAGNMTAKWAGGLACAWPGASMTIRNCTIWGNSAGSSAGGLGCYQGTSATVTNTILWGNTSPKGPEIYLQKAPTEFNIKYSDVACGQTGVSVEGGTLNWSEGNIDVDPCFSDPENDDYHLMSQAGRWDSESQVWIQDDVTSPCIDAGDPMSPIGLEAFPNGGFVNMGAYGGTPKASKSFFGQPVCETIVAGDINGDGQVNRIDLEIMALHWTDDEPLTLP
jgi:hypothetical protein